MCQASTFLAKYLLRGWGIYGLRASIQLYNAMAFLFSFDDSNNKNFRLLDVVELVGIVSLVELYIAWWEQRSWDGMLACGIGLSIGTQSIQSIGQC